PSRERSGNSALWDRNRPSDAVAMTSGQDGLLDQVRSGSYNRRVPRTSAFPRICLMFGSIGMPELIIIFMIALIIFGPRKMPELGRSLGKSLGEFKRASNELRNTLDEEIRLEEQRVSE